MPLYADSLASVCVRTLNARFSVSVAYYLDFRVFVDLCERKYTRLLEQQRPLRGLCYSRPRFLRTCRAAEAAAPKREQKRGIKLNFQPAVGLQS